LPIDLYVLEVQVVGSAESMLPVHIISAWLVAVEVRIAGEISVQMMQRIDMVCGLPVE
jgi:hypothetical protein